MSEPVFLTDLWYHAMTSAELRPGTLVARTLLNQPVVFGRDPAGTAFALLDLCPHRGIPLSCGRMLGGTVECAYHGWRFAPDGRCTEIPSLVEGQDFDPGRIRVRRFPLIERQGNIWIHGGDPGAGAGVGSGPDVPVLPDIGDIAPGIVETAEFPCALDHAVVGLMDPAHGPYVHASWWWRSQRSMHEKAKRFGPSPYGFTMLRHAPSSNSKLYKLLGGKPETEIRFQLPGIRIEHIRAGRNAVVNLTCVTPLTEDRTQVTTMLYWTSPVLSMLKPLVRPFVKRFLEQDRGMVAKQQAGLAWNPALMLINDSDTQAKWYYRLKKEYGAARAEGRDFVNPVPERTLRWRS